MHGVEKSYRTTTCIPSEDITCVVPTHGRPALLSRALGSIVKQLEPPARVIVADNLGDSETRAVVRSAAESSKIEIIHRVDVSNSRAFDNWRAGFASVETKYTKVVWDDDWLSETCLNTMADLINRHCADFVVCGAIGHVLGQNHLWYQYRAFNTRVPLRVLPLVALNRLPVSPLAGLQLTEDIHDACRQDWFHPEALSEGLVVGPDLAMTYIGILRNRKMVFTPTPLVHMFSDGNNMTQLAGPSIERYYIYTLERMMRSNVLQKAIMGIALTNRRRRLADVDDSRDV